jgi:hypothetical protein
MFLANGVASSASRPGALKVRHLMRAGLLVVVEHHFDRPVILLASRECSPPLVRPGTSTPRKGIPVVPGRFSPIASRRVPAPAF